MPTRTKRSTSPPKEPRKTPRQARSQQTRQDLLAGATRVLQERGAAGLTNGSFACLLTDLFPTRIRFTGVALVFNVSFTLFSGTAPLVATTLIRDTGQATSPAYMMMVSALLALVGSVWIERFGGNVMTRR